MRPHIWIRLTWPVGNNAFAYEQRKIHDPEPKLRLPEIKQITSIDEIEYWILATFAELDDNDTVVTYTGLKYIYHLPFCTDILPYVPTIPIYIFDNHNYALYFWIQQRANNIRPYKVIHIDQHSDLGTPPSPLKMGEWYSPLQNTDIAHHTTHICNVGNFIRPALDAGIITECIRIKNQYDLEHFFSIKDGWYPSLQETKKNYILDIDLDFRASGMDTNLQITIPLVQELIREASLVTIASSPYFLKQTTALQLLERLFTR